MVLIEPRVHQGGVGHHRGKTVFKVMRSGLTEDPEVGVRTVKRASKSVDDVGDTGHQ